MSMSEKLLANSLMTLGACRTQVDTISVRLLEDLNWTQRSEEKKFRYLDPIGYVLDHNHGLTIEVKERYSPEEIDKSDEHYIHQVLDILVAAFINETGKTPSQITADQLMHFSFERVKRKEKEDERRSKRVSHELPRESKGEGSED